MIKFIHLLKAAWPLISATQYVTVLYDKALPLFCMSSVPLKHHLLNLPYCLLQGSIFMMITIILSWYHLLLYNYLIESVDSVSRDYWPGHAHIFNTTQSLRISACMGNLKVLSLQSHTV